MTQVTSWYYSIVPVGTKELPVENSKESKEVKSYIQYIAPTWCVLLLFDLL